jgi:hypothetical protein
MAITLKDDALRGGRVEMLADLAGYSRHEALGRMIRLWDYCIGNETDTPGERVVRTFIACPIDVLVDCGLAEQTDDGVRVRGVRDEIAAKRRRADHAKRAGQVSAQLRSTPQSPQPGVDPENTASRPGEHSESTPSLSSLITDPGSDSPSPEPSSEIPRDLKQQGAGRKRGKNPEVPMPKDFAPGDWHREFAAENGIDLADQFGRFVDHHEAKGSTFASWPAALRKWLKNSVSFRAERQARLPVQSAEGRAGDAVGRRLEEIRRMEADAPPTEPWEMK